MTTCRPRASCRARCLRVPSAKREEPLGDLALRFGREGDENALFSLRILRPQRVPHSQFEAWGETAEFPWPDESLG
jgi:hypothetical protein